ncbi:hypothetical protein D3C80_406660 [compost metagenome]
MRPAHQRFETDDAVLRKLHLRLEDDGQCAGRDRAGEILFDTPLAIGAGFQRRVEFTPLAAAFILGAIKRHVGGDEQVSSAFRMLRPDGETDRDAGHDRPAADDEGLAAAIKDAGGKLARLGGSGGATDDDGEFVTAQPCDETAFADDLAQSVTRFQQQFVAGRMTERVVDRLKSVEVEDKQRQLLILRARIFDAAFKRDIECGAVRNPGQRIAIGEHFQTFIGAENACIGPAERLRQRRRLHLRLDIADDDRLALCAALVEHECQGQHVECQKMTAGRFTHQKRDHDRKMDR